MLATDQKQVIPCIFRVEGYSLEGELLELQTAEVFNFSHLPEGEIKPKVLAFLEMRALLVDGSGTAWLRL